MQDPWLRHRLLGHDLARVLRAVGLRRFARRLHDATLPAHRNHLWSEPPWGHESLSPHRNNLWSGPTT
jgi:hypothetical protein